MLRTYARSLRRGGSISLVRTRSLVLVVLGLIPVVFATVRLAEAYRDIPAATLLKAGADRATALSAAAPWLILPAAVLFVAIALLSIRSHTTVRVLAGIAGLLCAADLMVMTAVMFGNALGIDAVPSVLAYATALVVLIVAWAIGARR
ncbi:hypothetical protein [Microbacterium gorillae]|uniref:hypothetical protein n=1 Tax=Microbacterium gorillae TaxID=1231063 RepID=UPI00058E2F03|nr:hypothetical protein [Microbacterium gorillae]